MMRQRDTELRNENRHKGRSGDTEEHTETYQLRQKRTELGKGASFACSRAAHSSQLTAHFTAKDWMLGTCDGNKHGYLPSEAQRGAGGQAADALVCLTLSRRGGFSSRLQSGQ